MIVIAVIMVVTGITIRGIAGADDLKTTSCAAQKKIIGIEIIGIEIIGIILIL